MTDYFLTRRAILDLQNIYIRSVENWGEDIADKYIEALYLSFQRIAENPQLGQARLNRSWPFLMVLAKKHYVIYDTFPKGIIIVTLLHQVRNIERILEEFSPSFVPEITALKRQLYESSDH